MNATLYLLILQKNFKTIIKDRSSEITNLLYVLEFPERNWTIQPRAIVLSSLSINNRQRDHKGSLFY